MLPLKPIKLVDGMAWLMILAGGLVRMIQYLFNRSLWADEASLALNIVNRSYIELLQPLDYQQGAPIGFLFLEKLATQIFHRNEYSLRLVPLLGGLITLVLFYYLLRRYFQNNAIIFGLILIGFLYPFVYFSVEVKQYSTDVTVALCCFFIARQTEQSFISNSQTVILSLFGAILIWFSHPAIFILTGIILGLIVKSLWFKRVKLEFSTTIARRLVIYLSWLISFVLFYFVSLQALGSNQQLKSSWQGKGAFLPDSGNFIENLIWLLDRLGRFFYSPLGFATPWDGVAIALFLVGCFYFYRRKRGELFVILSPLVVTLLAAVIQKYPFHGRLVFFLTPIFILLIAEGMSQLISNRNIYIKGISIIVVTLLLFQALQKTIPLFYTPELREEIRPVIEYIKTHEKANDTIYVFQRGNLQFQFYANQYGYTPDDYILGIDDLDQYDGSDVSERERKRYYDDLDQLRGQSRVWVLFSHAWIKEENELVINYLDCLGKRLDSFRAVGAFVYLYDLSHLPLRGRLTLSRRGVLRGIARLATRSEGEDSMPEAKQTFNML